MRANKDRTAAPSVKVGELMTSGVITCAPETSAATAAALMLQGDYGILPDCGPGRAGWRRDRSRSLHRARHSEPATDRVDRRRGGYKAGVDLPQQRRGQCCAGNDEHAPSPSSAGHR